MKHISFGNVGPTSITLEFNCPKCSSVVKSDKINLPSPNFSGDSVSDSQVEDEDYIICSNCDEQYDVQLMSHISGGDVTIDGLNQNCNVEYEIEDDPNM